MRTESNFDEAPDSTHTEATLRDHVRHLQREFDDEPDQRQRNQILREMMELNGQIAALRAKAKPFREK